MKKMDVTNLDHYNIETVKSEETVWFYSEILGLHRLAYAIAVMSDSAPVPGDGK